MTPAIDHSLAWCFDCRAIRLVILEPGEKPKCAVCHSTNTGPHQGGHKRTDRWRKKRAKKR